MSAYNISRDGITTSTTDDSLTLVTAASGVGSVIGLYEVFIGGANGSSALSRNAVDRSTGGTTGGGALTPTPLATSSPATLGFFAYTTWAAQPTLSGARVLTPTFQGQGGQYKWFSAPDRPITVGSQGAAANLSFRCLSATSVISFDFKVELI